MVLATGDTLHTIVAGFEGLCQAVRNPAEAVSYLKGSGEGEMHEYSNRVMSGTRRTCILTAITTWGRGKA